MAGGRWLRTVAEWAFSDRGISSNRELKELISRSPDGFVPIGALLGCTSLIRYTQSARELAAACEGSRVVEVATDPLRIRRRSPTNAKEYLEGVDEHIEGIIHVENISISIFSERKLHRFFREYGEIEYLRLMTLEGIRAAEVAFAHPEAVVRLLFDFRQNTEKKFGALHICTLLEYIEYKRMAKAIEKEPRLPCFHLSASPSK